MSLLNTPFTFSEAVFGKMHSSLAVRLFNVSFDFISLFFYTIKNNCSKVRAFAVATPSYLQKNPKTITASVGNQIMPTYDNRRLPRITGDHSDITELIISEDFRGKSMLSEK